MKKPPKHERPLFHREYAGLAGRRTVQAIEPLIDKWIFAGSYRRMLPAVHDIDILVILKSEIHWKQLASILDSLCVGRKLDVCGPEQMYGEIKPDGLDPITFNLWTTVPMEYGAALMYVTGSQPYNAKCRAIAKSRGLLLNEHGVYRRKPKQKIPDAGFTEHMVCRTIGIPYLHPSQRTGESAFR